jgi:hypothetical protein
LRVDGPQAHFRGCEFAHPQQHAPQLVQYVSIFDVYVHWKALVGYYLHGRSYFHCVGAIENSFGKSSAMYATWLVTTNALWTMNNYGRTYETTDWSKFDQFEDEEEEEEEEEEDEDDDE